MAPDNSLHYPCRCPKRGLEQQEEEEESDSDSDSDSESENKRETQRRLWKVKPYPFTLENFDIQLVGIFLCKK